MVRTESEEILGSQGSQRDGKGHKKVSHASRFATMWLKMTVKIMIFCVWTYGMVEDVRWKIHKPTNKTEENFYNSVERK